MYLQTIADLQASAIAELVIAGLCLVGAAALLWLLYKSGGSD